MPAGMPSRGENINHFNGTRVRVLGQGELQLRFEGLPDNAGNFYEKVLVPMDLDDINQRREPLKKVNFMQQRARLVLETQEIDAYVKINRIVIFARPVFTNYPS